MDIKKFLALLCVIGVCESFISPVISPFHYKSIVKRNSNIPLRAFNISNGEINRPSGIIRKPIPIISFDEFFLNIKNINRMYLTSTCDRIIIVYGHGNKGVL